VTVESAAALLRRTAEITGSNGSPLSRAVLEAAADDLEAGGVTREVLRDELEADMNSAMALRFNAALHRLVLTGKAPMLAPFYPSVGGTERPDGIGPALRDAMEANRETLPALVALPCQTNEVGRSAGLVLGFLEVARATGLPLRILEIGSSAGLNLRWDRYLYTQGNASWGPKESPVRLRDRWSREPEVFAVDATVAERAGCDPNPLDPTDPEAALSLRSSLWADQTERFTLLDGAIRIASELPVEVEKATAGEWLERQLTEPRPGLATVVFHSVVWQYLTVDDRERVKVAIRTAGERATMDAPVAWLSTEPIEVAKRHLVRLTTWPAGETLQLAETGPHGDPVLVRISHP
jgi:hypothetical protein